MSAGGFCYSCGTEFGIFKKEHGCKNCGFAFCSKCLNKKIEVPRLNNSRVNVCNKCFGIIKGDIKPDTKAYSPPLAYKKRVEALKSGADGGGGGTNKGHSSSSGFRSSSSDQKKATSPSTSFSAEKYRGMAKADIEIAQRLEKLREKAPSSTETRKETINQLEDRLAALKGMDPSRYKESQKPVFVAPDRRTQQEQMDDLLEEIAATVALEESLPDPDQALRDQLARLRQNDGQTNRFLRRGSENDSDVPSASSGHYCVTPTNSIDSQCSAFDFQEFKLNHGNNLNKDSCTLDKQGSYEKNINFFPGACYGFMDPVNINALVSEVKQVKEEVARNLQYADSDNVTRAGDRKSWKNFEHEEAELEREAEELARMLTAQALREKEEEEKSKQ